MPTVAPTGDPSLVNAGSLTTNPAAFTGAGNPVNPAQAPGTPSTPAIPQSSSPQLMNQIDVSGLIANYEVRLRNLQSERDKAVNERNQAISAQAQMQQQLTDLQTSAATNISSAVGSAQTAIDENSRLRAQVQSLNAQLLRANTVLKKPHLAEYVDFLPTNGDEAAMTEAVAKLEQIRQSDLDRNRAQAPAYAGFPTPTPSTQLPPVPGVPPLPGQNTPAAQQNLYNLYNQRPTMAPGIPSSSPAMMNPAGAATTTDAINQMLTEARNSGDEAKFNQAMQQAVLLANNLVQQQMGG
jgi:hypothetical protein